MQAWIRPLVASMSIVAVLAVSAQLPDPTSAATLAARWRAPLNVGSRSQGSATLNAYTTGAGVLAIRMTRVRPYAAFSVGLYSGTCSRPGSRVTRLPTVTSTATGTVARNLAIGQTLMTRLRSLLRRGHLSVAVGSLSRCGTLVRLTLTPGPTPRPTPSPTPTPTPTPTLAPTPTPYVYPPPPTPPPYTYRAPTP